MSDNIDSSVEDLDWNALDKLKRNDLQRLCKEFSLPIKATSKNADIINALVTFKSEYDEKKKQKNIEQSNNTPKTDVNNNNKSNSNGNDNAKQDEEQGKEIISDKIIRESEIELEEQQKQAYNTKLVQEESQEHLLETLPIPVDDDDETTIKRTTMGMQKKRIHDEEDEDEDESSDEEQVKQVQHEGLKFRNYAPRESTLIPYRMPKSKVSPIVQELVERLKVLESGAEDNVSLLPKKSNWDLKRDVEKKLSKLEKKTNYAIYQLIKQKLEGTNEDDATKMNLLSRTVDKY